MAHKQVRGSTFMVDREFKSIGVGRIHRSSGTSSAALHRRINEMLDEFAGSADEDAFEVLRRLKSGSLSFLEALAAYKKRGLSCVRELAADAPVTVEAFDRWIRKHEARANTKASYWSRYNTLMRFARGRTTMRDIPRLLKSYSEWCSHHNRNYRSFDATVAVCKAWVGKELGRHSKTYIQLQEIKTFGRKPDPRQNPDFSPSEVRAVVNRLPDEIAEMLWCCALYGCGPKEYMADGVERVSPNGVRVKGQKRLTRDRVVPYIVPVVPAAVTNYGRLQRIFQKAAEGSGQGKTRDMQLYDLRRVYIRWMVRAGVEYYRARIYQGHAIANQSDQYLWHDTAEYLKTDGEKLKVWLEQQLAGGVATLEKVVVRPIRTRRKLEGFRTEYVSKRPPKQREFAATKLGAPVRQRVLAYNKSAL